MFGTNKKKTADGCPVGGEGIKKMGAVGQSLRQQRRIDKDVQSSRTELNDESIYFVIRNSRELIDFEIRLRCKPVTVRNLADFVDVWIRISVVVTHVRQTLNHDRVAEPLIA